MGFVFIFFAEDTGREIKVSAVTTTVPAANQNECNTMRRYDTTRRNRIGQFTKQPCRRDQCIQIQYQSSDEHETCKNKSAADRSVSPDADAQAHAASNDEDDDEQSMCRFYLCRPMRVSKRKRAGNTGENHKRTRWEFASQSCKSAKSEQAVSVIPSSSRPVMASKSGHLPIWPSSDANFWTSS